MFPGADAPSSADEYAILGAPLDRSATFRPGARFGPDRIRAMAAGFEDYDHRTETTFSAFDVGDHGDLRAWPDAEGYLEFLEAELAEIAVESTPILIGGEHTVTVAGVRATDPDVVVALDAHLDLRRSFDDDPYSHATVCHHALRVADRVVILGARAGSREEWARTEGDDVEVVAAPDLADWTPGSAGLDDPEVAVYCSVDLDVADASVVPGTGTPEPGGPNASTVRELVRSIAPHAVGFDVTEITDRDDGQTALLAAKLVRDFVHAHGSAP